MTADESQWEPWMEKLLNAFKEKFIKERVNGFKHPVSGVWFAPAPRAEVEARWKKKEPSFRRDILTDPEWREWAEQEFAGEGWKPDKPVSGIGFGKKPVSPATDQPVSSGTPEEPAATEPSQNVSLNQMLSGMQELTHDDLLDMWEKAKTLPEPQRQKAIQQITRLSKEFESRPAQMLVNILLETQF